MSFHKIRHAFALSLLIAFSLLKFDPAGPFPLGYALEQSAEPSLQFPLVPDKTMTTGSVCNPKDADYAGRRYPENIAYCRRTVDSQLKSAVYDAYGVPRHCRSQYTVDHFIPLSIGGTNQRNNLWPEHRELKALRKNLELDLFEDVRDGKITQADAIRRVREAKLNPPVTDPTQISICH